VEACFARDEVGRPFVGQDSRTGASRLCGALLCRRGVAAEKQESARAEAGVDFLENENAARGKDGRWRAKSIDVSIEGGNADADRVAATGDIH